MTSRHEVDTTTRFDMRRLPASKRIEMVDVLDVATEDPPTVKVQKEPYLVTDAVVEAVNIAIALGRPLLLQGDPGSGKTRLAYAVAYALGLPLEKAYVKSTTRAQDLLSTYDAVARLYDVQLGDRAPKLANGRPRPDDPGNYVRLGPFGRAIQRAQYGRRSVLLIDEIDKADLDFPNDLLNELDRLELEVPETGRVYAAPRNRPDLRPIIFVTHNEEKALPPAFLRRCIYHELRFPEDDAFLARVLAAHDVSDTALAKETVRVLLEVRKLDLSRKPGISELVDWARYLHAHAVEPELIRRLEAIGALIKSPLDQERARQALAREPS